MIAVRPDRVHARLAARTTRPIEAVGLAQYRFLARLGFFGFDAGDGGRQPGDSSGRAWPSWPGPSRSSGSRRRVPSWTSRRRPTVLQTRDRPSRPSPDGVRPSCRWPSSTRSGTIDAQRSWSDSDRPIAIRSRRRAIRARMDGIDREGAARHARSAGRGVHASRPGPVRDRDAGTAGVGGVYDIGRRMRAWLGGTTFRAEHSARSAASDRCPAGPRSRRRRRRAEFHHDEPPPIHPGHRIGRPGVRHDRAWSRPISASSAALPLPPEQRSSRPRSPC